MSDDKPPPGFTIVDDVVEAPAPASGKLPPDPEFAVGGTAGAEDEERDEKGGNQRAQREEQIPAGDTANLPEPSNFWPEFGPPQLPKGLLPARIETFARGAALSIGADIGGVSLAALAVAAAAIHDNIKIRVMPFTNWFEAARLWVTLVGGPSTKKTPIINAVCEALKREDHRLLNHYIKRKETWDALEKADRKLTPEPAKERLIIGDMTTEAAQEAFKSSDRGLLALYDELSGWFGAMDRYDHANRHAYDRAFMLQAYQGGSYTVDRIGRGSFVLKNLSLTILGGIQPDLIRKVSKTANDDGLIQRLTPIMLRPAGVAVSNEQAIADVEGFAVLIPQLLILQPPENTDHLLKFDPRAQDIQREFAEENRLMVSGLEGANRKLSTAFGKQDALFARLCVIWHAVDHAGGALTLPPIVSEDTARRVATFMRKFTQPHLKDFYDETLELPDEHERLKAIAGFILSKNLKTVANRDVQAGVRLARGLASKEITQVLEHLELRSWLFRGNPLRLGAPPVWNVNPLVHERFGRRAEIETGQREKIKKLLEQKFSVARHPTDDDN